MFGKWLLSLLVPAALAASLSACNESSGTMQPGVVNTSASGSYSGDSGRVVSIREVPVRGSSTGVSNGTFIGGGLGAAGGAAIGAATTHSVGGALIGGLLGAVGGAIAGTASSLYGGCTTLMSAVISSAIGLMYNASPVPLVVGSLLCCASALVLIALAGSAGSAA